MRKAISVSALILALTCPVYAGDMPNGSPQPPPPAPASATQEPTGGEMPNGEPALAGEILNDVPGDMTQIALDLLALLPSLL